MVQVCPTLSTMRGEKACTIATKKWLKKKGFELIFKAKADDRVDFTARRVFINSLRKWKNRLPILMHECGHIIVHQKRNVTKRRHYGSRSRDWISRRGRPSIEFKILTFFDELGAWEEGQNLAKKMGIKFCSTEYNRIKAKCLKSYMTWGAL